MGKESILSSLNLPKESSMTGKEYITFLERAYLLFQKYPQYLCGSEGIESLELAHLILKVPETVLAIYIGINDAVCNKGLITPFLPRHAHNNVFVFDPQIWTGGDHVPSGTVDARFKINGFMPPNASWDNEWTYVMIKDPKRKFESLYLEKGYIDLIPAKFEDFTMLSDTNMNRLCTFIDPRAFEHPVNKSRKYLKYAREKGDKMALEFYIPDAMKGETEGLVPVVLNRGEKLYVARIDFQPCDHCWSNIHPENNGLAVVNENSAIPLNLVISKPPVSEIYRSRLIPPAGSADFTTDWFFRGKDLFRKPIKSGQING